MCPLRRTTSELKRKSPSASVILLSAYSSAFATALFLPSCEALSDMIMEAQHLKILSLRDNRVGPKGIATLSAGLRVSRDDVRLPSLRCSSSVLLSFFFLSFSDITNGLLANVLQCNTSLEELDLRNSSGGVRAALYLSDVFRGNTTLRVLWMNARIVLTGPIEPETEGVYDRTVPAPGVWAASVAAASPLVRKVMAEATATVSSPSAV